jgi:hypothetical protein
VLTYKEPEAVDPEFKKEAVKRENSFIRWLREEQKKLGNPNMEYAKTWEITKKGRLHTNLVVGPWKYDQAHKPGRYIPMEDILARWGARVSISIVKDDRAVSREATKALSPDGLSSYLTKIEQMVPENWHRAISFSKGYPKLPLLDPPERVGQIRWESERDLEPGALAAFLHEKGQGWWLETEKGSGEFYDGVKDERCRCFDWKEPEVAVESYYHPPGELPELSPASEIEARQLVELYS